MDIFRKRKEIYLSENINDEVEKQRIQYEIADSSLLADKSTKYIDINEMTELSDGRICINVNKTRFECMFRKGTGCKLYVFLAAARTRANGLAPLPLLQRWSYYNVLEDSVLCVSDPMYYDYPNLQCGWFWGNNEENYREYLAQLVSKIAEISGINKENVVFFGSSAGGTAAIHTAAIFGAGTAICLNGQLNFEYEKFTRRIEHFCKVTNFDITQKDKFERNMLHNVVKKSTGVKFIVVDNVCSDGDIKDHLMYFCDKINYVPKFGLSSCDNMIFWLYEAKSSYPHTAFEDKNILFALDYLTQISPKDIESLDRLYQLFSSFWYSNYSNQNNKNIIKQQSVAYELSSTIQDIISFKLEQSFGNINIECKSNEYNRFSFDKFETNRVYIIKFNATLMTTQGIYDVGVFDKKTKKFILKHSFDSNKENAVAFYSGDSQDIELCIFAGLHGKTKMQCMQINSLNIYTSDLTDEGIRDYFKMKNRFQTARIDVKLEKGQDISDNMLHVSNLGTSYCDVVIPTWYKSNEEGYVIISGDGWIKMKLKTSGSGKMKIFFRGVDKKIEGKRVPIWVDYISIKIDGEEIIDTVTATWHDKSIQYVKEVQDGMEVIVECYWKPHIA